MKQSNLWAFFSLSILAVVIITMIYAVIYETKKGKNSQPVDNELSTLGAGEKPLKEVPLIVKGKTLTAVEYATKKANLIAKYDYTVANENIKETYEDRTNRLDSNDLQELLDIVNIELAKRGGEIKNVAGDPFSETIKKIR